MSVLNTMGKILSMVLKMIQGIVFHGLRAMLWIVKLLFNMCSAVLLIFLTILKVGS